MPLRNPEIAPVQGAGAFPAPGDLRLPEPVALDASIAHP